MGIRTWDLHLSGCGSLKDKRRIVRSLKDQLHHRFNVSVAETNYHKLWQRTELACCVVASDRRHAASVLGSADRLVEREAHSRVIDSSSTFL
ncbi:MAG: DUF503 domain-containing protein [Gemmatimonadales bacterium]